MGRRNPRAWAKRPGLVAMAAFVDWALVRALPPQAFSDKPARSGRNLLGETGEGAEPFAPCLTGLCASGHGADAPKRAERPALPGGLKASLQEANRADRRRLVSIKASKRAARRVQDETARRKGAGWARLVASGRIGDDEALAAAHMTDVLERIEAGAMARTDLDQLALGKISVTGRPGAPHAADVHGYADIYLPWAKELGHPDKRLGPRGRFTGRQAMAATLDVVRDGLGFREVERANHWRNGDACGLVVEALRLYAKRMPKPR